MMKWQWIGAVCLGVACGANTAVPEVEAATAKVTKRNIIINNVKYRRTGAESAGLGSVGTRVAEGQYRTWQSAPTGLFPVVKVEPITVDWKTKGGFSWNAAYPAELVSLGGKYQGAAEGKYKVYKLTIEPGSYKKAANADQAWLATMRDADRSGVLRIVTAVWVLAEEGSQAQSMDLAIKGGATVKTVTAGVGIATSASSAVTFPTDTIMAYSLDRIVWNKDRTQIDTTKSDPPGMF